MANRPRNRLNDLENNPVERPSPSPDDSHAGENWRAMPEYQQGLEAFRQLWTVDECPYSQGSPGRLPWLTGWYDARTLSRHGETFRRAGVTWP